SRDASQRRRSAPCRIPSSTPPQQRLAHTAPVASGPPNPSSPCRSDQAHLVPRTREGRLEAGPPVRRSALLLAAVLVAAVAVRALSRRVGSVPLLGRAAALRAPRRAPDERAAARVARRHLERAGAGQRVLPVRRGLAERLDPDPARAAAA